MKKQATILVVLLTILSIPTSVFAQFMWVQRAWSTEANSHPGGNPLRAQGHVVNPEANRVQFKAYAQTTLTDPFIGDSSVHITFSRQFKVVGHGVSEATLDGLIYGKLLASMGAGGDGITLFNSKVSGSALIQNTDIRILFKNSASDVPGFLNPSIEKEISDSPTDTGLIVCNRVYTVSGIFDLSAESGFFNTPGQAKADFNSDNYRLEVGVSTGPCMVPEPGSITLMASLLCVVLIPYRRLKQR